MTTATIPAAEIIDEMTELAAEMYEDATVLDFTELSGEYYFDGGMREIPGDADHYPLLCTAHPRVRSHEMDPLWKEMCELARQLAGADVDSDHRALRRQRGSVMIQL